jgi:hypothetical protein
MALDSIQKEKKNATQLEIEISAIINIYVLKALTAHTLDS